MSKKKNVVAIDLSRYSEEEKADILAGKESFLLYNQWGDLFNMLDDKEAGQVIKAVFAFEIDSEELETVKKFDKAQQMLYQTIRKALIINKEKYIGKSITNRKNGALGGRPPMNQNDTTGQQGDWSSLEKEFPNHSPEALFQIAQERGMISD